MSSEDASGRPVGPEPMDVVQIEGGGGQDEAMDAAAGEDSVLDVTFETAHDEDDIDDDIDDEDEEEISDIDLDCYPYTFSPLLLFAESKYFDKGHSN